MSWPYCKCEYCALQNAAPDLLKVARMALAASLMELGEAAAPEFSPLDMRDAASAAIAEAEGRGADET